MAYGETEKHKVGQTTSTAIRRRLHGPLQWQKGRSPGDERGAENSPEQMGLTLSEEKTKVTHITEGFDFLGYRVIRSIGTKGKMIPKVLIPERAIKRFRYQTRRIFAPSSQNESAKAKIRGANRFIRGWCEYYRCTNSPGRVFDRLRPEVFWGMAHWLGRKYKINMPEVMEKYRDRRHHQIQINETGHANRVQSQEICGKNLAQPLYRTRTSQGEKDRSNEKVYSPTTEYGRGQKPGKDGWTSEKK